MIVKSPTKGHGAKVHLARRLVELAPKEGVIHRVETHCFGASFMLACDPNGVSEVVNDIDRWVSNFWQVIKHDHTFGEFNRVIQATPFSELEWSTAHDLVEILGWSEVDHKGTTTGNVLRAVAWFVDCRQSLAGRMDSFAPLSRRRVRRGMNEQAAAWLSAVEGLPEVHERIKRWVILNQDGTEVIKKQDGEGTLFYVDVPYVHSTRASKDVYHHEMTDQQHADMLTVLVGIKGRFMLSGYHNEMYDECAKANGWRCVEFDRPSNAASGATKQRRTECVWMNYE